MNHEKEIGTKQKVDVSGTVSGSRRKLLASIGLAGTALVAGSLWSAANVQGKRVTEAVYGAEKEGCCWPKVTIAELRSLSTAPAEFYEVTDPGKEGVFRFDPADVSSADDTGLVIVSATGARFKRIFQGAFNVKWFGAKGDNASDDTQSIQAAVDAAQNRGAVVYFPSSDFYLISSPILIDSSKRGIRLIGDDYNRRVHSSIIRPHASVTVSAPLEAIFKFTDTEVGNQFEFSNLDISGDNKTKYGIYSKKIAHSLFRRISIKGTTLAALAIGYGWCNDVETCEISYNRGDGIQFVDGEVNVFNVVNTKIFTNDGIGIYLSRKALGVRINGCNIEGNKVCGVFARNSIMPFDLSDNYFENNGSVGYSFVNPERLVKAQIIINGTVVAATVGNTQPVSSIRIVNNFASLRDADCLVACYSAKLGLEIGNNSISRSSAPFKAYTLLRTGTSRTGMGAWVNNLKIYGNGVAYDETYASLASLQIEDLAAAKTHFHKAEIQGVARVNYSPGLGQFVPVTTGSGSFASSSATYRTYEAFELSGAANTSDWGFTIDLAQYPELESKYVYFAFYARASEASTGAAAYSSQLGPNTSAYFENMDWQLVSYVDLLPSSGTVSFGIRKLSVHATSLVYVAHPVLSEVGVPYEWY
ncbi:glycosyl hydrolase family 28-related protein [Paenibacillus mesophilus]|uniref:glycosyl hydrolase family 28-related protein n=1 Tax=Paenibacillus mesophilus TaxID=2582849 RepID=UPI0013053259|nr:glycosyl hydrolase family 28-related protein [Paenibacillus mesophilus]